MKALVVYLDISDGFFIQPTLYSERVVGRTGRFRAGSSHFRVFTQGLRSLNRRRRDCPSVVILRKIQPRRLEEVVA